MRMRNSNKANSIWEFDFVIALHTVDNVKPMCHLCSCQIAGGFTIQPIPMCLCKERKYKNTLSLRLNVLIK